MGRRSHKQVETDNEVHALLVQGKNLYQSHLAKKGITISLTLKDYVRAIVHDQNPEAMAAMRITSQLHQLQPGEYDAFMTRMRKGE